MRPIARPLDGARLRAHRQIVAAASKYAGGLSMISIAIAAMNPVVFVASTYLGFAGHVPLMASAVLNLLSMQIAFTILHEASHRNLTGRHKRWAWLNDLLGWINAFQMGVALTGFRHSHLLHHMHTNDAKKDPDILWKGPLHMALCKCIVGSLLILLPVLQTPGGLVKLSDRRGVRRAIPGLLVRITWLAITVLAWRHGKFAETIMLWLVPVIISRIWLALTIQWAPHHPHSSTDLFHNSNIILFPLAELIFGWQNYHLIHHITPTVPFYRLTAVYRETADLLASAKAPILRLRDS